MDEFMNEEEQWEAVKAWIRANWLWIVGGVAIGISGLASWRFWEAKQEQVSQEASLRYEQALDALAKSDKARAFELFDELHADYGSTPYVQQGDLAAARVHVDAGEFDEAATLLEQVMKTADDDALALVARGRLARIRVQQGRADDALALISTPTASGFTGRYAEIRGDALLAKGDAAGALAAYREASGFAASGQVDAGLIELKIADLAAVSPDAAGQPDAAAPADASASDTVPATPADETP